jgi:hypothetical protein
LARFIPFLSRKGAKYAKDAKEYRRKEKGEESKKMGVFPPPSSLGVLCAFAPFA